MKNERRRGVRIENFLPCGTQNVRLLEWKLGNLHVIFRVCTHTVGNNATNNRPDSQSVRRFFQTIAFSPALWNACDYVLQFNLKVAHIVGSVNTATDFLSRLELKVTDKILPKIWEDIHVTPTEVTTSSSDVAVEKYFLFTQAANENEYREHTFQRQEQSRQDAKDWVANKEPSSSRTPVEE